MSHERTLALTVIGEWKVSTYVKEWNAGPRTYVEILHDSGSHLLVQTNSRISKEITTSENPDLSGFQMPPEVLEAAKSALLLVEVMLK